MVDPFIGQINMVPYTFAPRGWADCNGQLLSIAEHQALFSLLGTTYGGDGRTTFALPDLRGRVPVHTGQGPGLSNHTLGQRGGVESVTLTANQMPQHTHGLSQAKVTVPISEDPPSATGGPLAAGAFYAETPAANYPGAGLSGSTDPAGGSQPVSIQPPYLGLRFVIALVGQYPSRN